jgi:hydroxyethylthiazole kinase
MADDPNEAAEVTSIANALVLNMGTLSESRLAAMLSAGKAANEKCIPVILDPVGVQVSRFRREAAREILSKVKISAVRGNATELSYLAGLHENAALRGVDASDNNKPDAHAARLAAQRLGCVCASTGVVDIISDGSREIRIYNGCKELKKITGAGCMTTALAAAFSAVTTPFCGTVLGIAFMGICGEYALEHSASGAMGSFHAALFDCAGSMTDEYFLERLKADEF